MGSEVHFLVVVVRQFGKKEHCCGVEAVGLCHSTGRRGGSATPLHWDVVLGPARILAGVVLAASGDPPAIRGK